MKNTQLENALNKYINEDMIMVFDSFRELIDFINYDCPEIEQQVSTWDDVKSVLDKYVFYYNKRYYDIMFDEALKVRDYLPRGFFEMPQKLKHTDTYDEFEAYVDGMLEGKDTLRFKSEIINEYAHIIGDNDWIEKSFDIKSKMDFKCFNDTDYYSDEERETFIEDLKDYLELESINIDDPKTWLPKLKRWMPYFEDIGFTIQSLENDFYDTLGRLYDGIEDYNYCIEYAQKVVEFYNSYYLEKDCYVRGLEEDRLAFVVGQIYQLEDGCHNAYNQKRIFEMAKKCWKEFDGFSFDEEDYK